MHKSTRASSCPQRATKKADHPSPSSWCRHPASRYGIERNHCATACCVPDSTAACPAAAHGGTLHTKIRCTWREESAAPRQAYCCALPQRLLPPPAPDGGPCIRTARPYAESQDADDTAVPRHPPALLL